MVSSFAQFTTTTTFNSPYCIGASTGNITLTASTGTAPYTVQMLAPTTGSIITMTGSSPATYTYTGLAEGAYTFRITDNNGAIVNRNITLTDPTPFSFSNFAFINSTGVSTCDSINLSFSHYSNGGTNRPNYTTEFWINVPSSNPNGSVPATSPTITYNRTYFGGTFRIPITGANTITVARVTDSCGNTLATNISTLPAITGVITKSTTVCNTFDVEPTYNGLAVPITFTLDSNGVTKKTLIQSSIVGATGGGSYTGGNMLTILPGNYTLKAVDNCGTVVTTNLSITNPAKPTLQSQISVAGCSANNSVDSTGAVGVNTGSYNQPYTFTFLSGPASYNHTNTSGVLATNFTYPLTVSTVGEITNLPMGTYRVALTDNCGFTDTATFTIDASNISKVDLSATVTPGCLDANTVTVNGVFNCYRSATNMRLYNSTGSLINSTGITSSPISFSSYNLPSGNYTIRLFGARPNYIGVAGGTSFIQHIYPGAPSAVIPVSFAPYTGPTVDIILRSPCPNSTVGSLVAKAVGVPPYSYELIAPLSSTVIRASQTDSVFNSVNLSDSFRVSVTDGCGNVSVSSIVSFAGVPRNVTINSSASRVSCVAIGAAATFAADSIDAFTYKWTGQMALVQLVEQ